jgi:hypothetical protein
MYDVDMAIESDIWWDATTIVLEKVEDQVWIGIAEHVDYNIDMYHE